MGRTDRNTAEIEVLYRQHGAALLLFASAISGDRGRAQDALHQVFLKVIENGSLEQAIDRKSYLFACVRNAVLNDAKLQIEACLLTSTRHGLVRQTGIMPESGI